MNIIRAAYRKPLQFSEFSTVTGQATSSATAGFSFPLAAVPATAARITTFSPTATVSGGPQFTVSMLDTQEFYEGITNPIQLPLISYYISEGFPKPVLLSLLISEIQIRSNGHLYQYFNTFNPTVKFTGSPGGTQSKPTLGFEGVLQELIGLGLSVDQSSKTESVGPAFAVSQVQDLKAIANLITQNVSLKKYSLDTPDPNLTDSERQAIAKSSSRDYYRVVKQSSSPRFCFDPDNAKEPPQIGRPIADTGLTMTQPMLCGTPADTKQSGAARPSTATRSSPFILSIPAALPPAENPTTQPSKGTSSGNAAHFVAPNPMQQSPQPDGLIFTTRSVEQIIYYLGEIARNQLQLTDEQPVAPQIAAGSCNGTSVLFQLHGGYAGGMSISAQYGGASYSIAVDPKGCDRSSQVLGLLAELLALNTSAKNLPAPNVITVLTR